MKIDRQWAMPNKHTFSIQSIKKLIERYVQPQEIWLDPFANENKMATITNDLNPEYETDYHRDALDFLKLFPDKSVDGVLYDPPYSSRQVSEVYKNFGREVTMATTQSSFWARHKDEIARVLKPCGKVISFGWNSQGCGKNRGFEMDELLIVAHGGSHHDTLITVEHKNSSHEDKEKTSF